MSLSSRDRLVRLVSKRSSPPRIERVEDIIVVEHGMHERLLGLIVMHIDVGSASGSGPSGISSSVSSRWTHEIVAADIEEVPVAQPGQIDRGGQVLCGRAGDAVVAVEGAVRGGVHVPAEAPAVGDREIAGGPHAAAEIAVAAERLAVVDERVLVLLEDAGEPDRIGAVQQPVPPFRFHQQALAGQEGRREGHVVVRREVPEERRRHAEADRVALAEGRRQKAGLAPDRRIGMEETAHRRSGTPKNSSRACS